MRACVLGTSNGIIADGYLAAITESSLFSSVINASIGASSCAFFPYRLDAIDTDTIDVIFVESLVNDAASARARAFNLDQIEMYYSYLFALSAKKKIAVICIVLPGRTQDEFSEEALKNQLRVMNRNNVQLWNLNEDISTYAAMENTSVFSLYRDAAHLDSSVIRNICHSRLQSQTFLSKNYVGQDWKFKYIPLASIARDTGALKLASLNEIETKLVRAQGIFIKDRLSIDLEFGLPSDNLRLVSLVLNSNRTNCYLILDGLQRISKRLTFDLVDNNNKIIVSPLTQPLEIADDRIKLAFSEETVSNTEESYQAKAQGRSTPQIEIVGFVVQIT